MEIDEYQAKELFREYGIPSPPFIVLDRAEALEAAYMAMHELSHKKGVVLKVQVRAGGRGKVGGVKVVKSLDEAWVFVERFLHRRIVTSQTGKEGLKVEKILLTPYLEYKQEYYLALLLSRKEKRITLVASKEGGVEIEEVARTFPEKILKIHLTLGGELYEWHFIRFLKFMGWNEPQVKEAARALLHALGRFFVEKDVTLLELNPLVLIDQTLVPLDAKVSLDDNALFRHSELYRLTQDLPLNAEEAAAKSASVSYVSLEGEIGCMVNGAGLAMATMDVIKHFGGRPANFLDVGGSADVTAIAASLRILLDSPQVKVVLINIFGGIMNCETVAAGIIQAVSVLQLKVPLVVRLEGTHVEEGKALLTKTALPIHFSDSLESAAVTAIHLVAGG